MHFIMDFNNKMSYCGTNMSRRAIVIGIHLRFGLFDAQRKSGCVYTETAKKQGSFCCYTVWNITGKLVRR